MKQPKKEHIIRRLLWEARPIWKWLLLAALLCIGVIVCGVLGPKLLGGLIDRLYAWWERRIHHYGGEIRHWFHYRLG